MRISVIVTCFEIQTSSVIMLSMHALKKCPSRKVNKPTFYIIFWQDLITFLNNYCFNAVTDTCYDPTGNKVKEAMQMNTVPFRFLLDFQMKTSTRLAKFMEIVSTGEKTNTLQFSSRELFYLLSEFILKWNDEAYSCKLPFRKLALHSNQICMNPKSKQIQPIAIYYFDRVQLKSQDTQCCLSFTIITRSIYLTI